MKNLSKPDVQKKSRKGCWVLACVLTCLAGTGLHFLHDLLPNPLTALLAPVNESVWEHLKLLYWPFLVAMLVLGAGTKKPAAFWGAAFTGLLAMPVFLLGVYYFLSGALGLEALWVDIPLYYLTLVLGFAVTWRLRDAQAAAARVGTLAMLVGIFGAMLVIFTFGAPELPIFISKI